MSCQIRILVSYYIRFDRKPINQLAAASCYQHFRFHWVECMPTIVLAISQCIGFILGLHTHKYFPKLLYDFLSIVFLLNCVKLDLCIIHNLYWFFPVVFPWKSLSALLFPKEFSHGLSWVNVRVHQGKHLVLSGYMSRITWYARLHVLLLFELISITIITLIREISK